MWQSGNNNKIYWKHTVCLRIIDVLSVCVQRGEYWFAAIYSWVVPLLLLFSFFPSPLLFPFPTFLLFFLSSFLFPLFFPFPVFSFFFPFDEYLSFRIIFKCPVLPSHVFILKSFVFQVNDFYGNLYYMGLVFPKLNGEVHYYYYYYVTFPEK